MSSQLGAGAVIQGRYRIHRKLGEGGMGVVYEAQHLRIKRRLAIKVLHPQFARTDEVLQRFHREAEAASAIGHPNIVEVTDYGETEDGAPFMVLEFLEGRDWSKDIATEGPQPLGKVAHILCQVCRGLHAAHALGIVHRDLKPENIFLLEREGDPNYAKVVDFGISKFQQLNDAKPHSLTRTGTVMGTPYYMSPEQCQGAPVDARADIYSLGVIMFQAFTGRYPFDSELFVQLLMEICSSPAPSVAQFRSDLPAPVVSLVERLLSKSPDDRPASCLELEAALRPYVSDTTAPALVHGAASAPSARTPPRAGATTPLPMGAATPHTMQLPDSVPTPMAVANSTVPAVSSSRSALWIGVAMGALCVAGGVAFTLAAFGGEEDAAPASGPVASEPPTSVDVAAAPAVEAPDEPADEEAPASVAVHISVTPSEAQLSLGGAPLPNPFAGALPSSTAPAMLVARAPGYETIERTLDLTTEQRIELALEPIAALPQEEEALPQEEEVVAQEEEASSPTRQRQRVLTPRLSPTPLSPRTGPREVRAARSTSFGL